MVVSSGNGTTNLVYIWDVTDHSGNRVNRLSGEEMAGEATPVEDRWTSVSLAATKIMAEKAIALLASSIGMASAQKPAPPAQAASSFAQH